MSLNILFEVSFLFHSFLMGISITVIYDVLRILRRVILHSLWVVSLEDLLYWIGCSVWIFRMLCRENNGILRWFAVAGAMAGMFLYKKTLGNIFVQYFSLLISYLLHLVEKLFFLILRPLALVLKSAHKRLKKPWKWLKMGIRRLKKKLTEGRKTLKMILCKH